MASEIYQFGEFALDAPNRQLTRAGARIDLNARYLDALVLFVREPAALLTKDRLLDDVWGGVPVTDEALTQCIRTLRRTLGDNAGAPRFIETVPKHGYRFIARVESIATAGSPAASTLPAWRSALQIGAGGTIGGGVAGLVGGLIYGFLGASQPLQPGTGAASVLLVLMTLTTIVGVLGGAGVSFGIAAASLAPVRPAVAGIAGGLAGGLLIGAIVKLLGLDAFSLLLGDSPAGITGAFEGALLGAAVGLGATLAGRPAISLRRSVAIAGVIGAAAGLAIILAGGRMMAGSLAIVAERFPGSRLHLDHFGVLAGEAGFGIYAQMVTGTLEGMLFAACVVGAITIARGQFTAASR